MSAKLRPGPGKALLQPCVTAPGTNRVRALVDRALRRLSLVADRETETQRREEEYRLVGQPGSMKRETSRVNELRSVALMRQFLPECEHHGSPRLAGRLVILGRSKDQMRAPVD